MSAAVALVLHDDARGNRAWVLDRDRRNPAIVDEREAMRLARGFCEGANLAASRIATALFPGMRYSSAWLDFMREYGEPTYTQIRNYLEGDCNVAPLLAQRVALCMTQPIREAL